MRVLRDVKPTSEQLAVMADIRPGVTLIKGAAGSGKTTTALLRLKLLVEFWKQRKADGLVEGPVRVLVLTYNRTLRGYIAELAAEQLSGAGVDMDITTFGKWSWDLVKPNHFLADEDRDRILDKQAVALSIERRFLSDEVDYALGRFLPPDIDSYLTVKRSGRGLAPRMERPMRERLLQEVVGPYNELKERQSARDWNDLAVTLATQGLTDPYHIVIVDETQDFSANQVRAVMNHLAADHTVTFVMDATQRIYPRGFAWSEVGIQIDPRSSFTLRENHRNTRQIAAFSAPLVSGLEPTDDGTLPDFSACTRDGPRPILVRGPFALQMDYVINELKKHEGHDESTALLHSQGGRWFDYARTRLKQAGIGFVEITREKDWPGGDEEVALSTMASAKGLEFNHVVILGLNARATPHGVEEGDSLLEGYRRLFAMAVGRARESVIVTYKPSEASALLQYLDPTTFDTVG